MFGIGDIDGTLGMLGAIAQKNPNFAGGQIANLMQNMPVLQNNPADMAMQQAMAGPQRMTPQGVAQMTNSALTDPNVVPIQPTGLGLAPQEEDMTQKLLQLAYGNLGNVEQQTGRMQIPGGAGTPMGAAGPGMGMFSPSMFLNR